MKRTSSTLSVSTGTAMLLLMACAPGPVANRTTAPSEPLATARTTPPNPEDRPLEPAVRTFALGLHPLSEAESDELNLPECMSRLQELLQHADEDERFLVERARAVLRALKDAPQGELCVQLAVREAEVYFARAMEVEVVASLLTIARGRVPDRAPPIPLDLQALREQRILLSREDFAAGWEEVEGVENIFSTPVGFQYEIRPNGLGTIEIVGRGFPVQNSAQPEEYFVRVDGGDDVVVYRR